MMQQLKKMQQEMARVQDELANTIVEGSAAGGVVRARPSGASEKAAADSRPNSAALASGAG